MKTIHFLFSSITFFQLYIPILLEAQKRNIQSIFYIRKNKKDYANVFSKGNKEIFDNFVEQYNIQVESIDNLISIKGLLFVVDGDIYGPPEVFKKNSNLYCTLDESSDCIHIHYVLALPELGKI